MCISKFVDKEVNIDYVIKVLFKDEYEKAKEEFNKTKEEDFKKVNFEEKVLIDLKDIVLID